MIYEFKCNECGKVFDEVRKVAQMNEPATCPCGGLASRQFAPGRIHLFGTSVEHPEFNHGLGMVIKNKKHRKDEARARGMEEIGNEKTESIHKHDEQALKEKLRRNWEKV